MKTMNLKEKMPTFVGYMEKRREAKRNQLPKHLRPLSMIPIYVQLALNTAIIIALAWLMLNQDEFVTEAAPAMVMVICFFLLIFTLVEAFQLHNRYKGLKGERWVKVNAGLMGIAFLTWVASVVNFIP